MTIEVSAAPEPSPSTIAPSPSGSSVLGASGSGAFGPGTYETAFEPRARFSLQDQTILGPNGTIAYESIGQTDVNSPGWVSISFGFDKESRHGSGSWSADFSIERIDQVFDPRHAKPYLIGPPHDFAGWLAHLPDVTLSAPPIAVRIGGLEATQLDLVAGDRGLTIGPIPGTTDPPAFGMGPRQPARLTVVRVEGQQVLISLAGVDGADHLARVITALQPIVDSIVWR
jgi:hypothetical protein